MTTKKLPLVAFFILFNLSFITLQAKSGDGSKMNFDASWKFHLGDLQNAQDPAFNDGNWRILNLPHDWSISGTFNKNNPATVGGGALPGGIGWYRKSFLVPSTNQNRLMFIDFDGVYMNSVVWINGHYLGKRPYGYSSFRYELTPYLHYGKQPNLVAVRVDNSHQPNSRWYSGSGIYRNVWLVTTPPTFVDHWGTFITTPDVSPASARVDIQTSLTNQSTEKGPYQLITLIYDQQGKLVSKISTSLPFPESQEDTILQEISLSNPHLWSMDHPYLYQAKSIILASGKIRDQYYTSFGIRSFHFDANKGFFLNGRPVKILGVCDHHDLGCLGSAINTRALQRQLQLLKAMGCNAIRTSHNPPAPELLNWCDKMGFLVMDEAFDCWKKGKNPYDYHLYWDKWHKKDLLDLIRRDRNHPSVFIWSIGNEIPDQWDSVGGPIARELAGLVKSLDTTRPITSALNGPESKNNFIAHAGALDLIGYNYNISGYKFFHQNFPGQKFIATETTSALETRGHYDMPSDSIRRWPLPKNSPDKMNANYTCSAYDNCSTPWGSTHEEGWKAIKKHAYLSGMFIWTGFDYLGEPTPYGWPARSSYFGIIDLAGFPKDVYYMYQSEWTDSTVLHIFPHWNWKKGDTVDIWAYYNHADQVELFLNGKSLGIRSKHGDDLHVMWRVPFEPGTLVAISRKGGRIVKKVVEQTAGQPAKIILEADRKEINANGRDLSFVTVKIEDQHGIVEPHADNLVHFTISGPGFIAGVDNGSETDHEPFQANYRKAFHGLALVVIQTSKNAGEITLNASADGLSPSTLILQSQKK
ncbi:MAG: beta-galactosidase GalB [Chitinophagaceae bacterium]